MLLETTISITIHLFLFYIFITNMAVRSALVGPSFAVFVASIIYVYYSTKKKQDSLPPRAPGYVPVIGHLLQLAKPMPIQQLFYEWSLKAGPIFTCYFGKQRWIVLNSLESVKDLIVDRGTVYSSRNLPDTLVQDLFQGGISLYM